MIGLISLERKIGEASRRTGVVVLLSRPRASSIGLLLSRLRLTHPVQRQAGQQGGRADEVHMNHPPHGDRMMANPTHG